MNHRVFNISTGNVEIDSKFPTETSAFLGLDPAKNVQFHSTGETEFVSLLLDGNRTVYPLAKDSTPSADSIKDPQWVDLPPIGAVGKKMINWIQSFLNKLKQFSTTSYYFSIICEASMKCKRLKLKNRYQLLTLIFKLFQVLVRTPCPTSVPAKRTKSRSSSCPLFRKQSCPRCCSATSSLSRSWSPI